MPIPRHLSSADLNRCHRALSKYSRLGASVTTIAFETALHISTVLACFEAMRGRNAVELGANGLWRVVPVDDARV